MLFLLFIVWPQVEKGFFFSTVHRLKIHTWFMSMTAKLSPDSNRWIFERRAELKEFAANFRDCVCISYILRAWFKGGSHSIVQIRTQVRYMIIRTLRSQNHFSSRRTETPWSRIIVLLLKCLQPSIYLSCYLAIVPSSRRARVGSKTMEFQKVTRFHGLCTRHSEKARIGWKAASSSMITWNQSI